MNREELIGLLTERFYQNFAEQTAAIVVGSDSVDTLYELACGSVELRPSDKDKVVFRAAYTLDTIYFNCNDLFTPTLVEQFWRDFPTTTNESAKRHFTKIMNHLLGFYVPSDEDCERIAEACALWATDVGAKVAVQIGAINVMMRLRDRVDWLAEILEELLEASKVNPSPAMQVSLKRWCLPAHGIRPNGVSGLEVGGGYNEA